MRKNEKNTLKIEERAMNRLFLLCTAIFLFACGGKQHPLIGKWKLSEFEITDPNAGDLAKQESRRLAEEISYEFLPRQRYVIYSPSSPSGKEGEWQISEDGVNAVILKMDEQPRVVLAFEVINDSTISCRSKTTRMGDVSFTLKSIIE